MATSLAMVAVTVADLLASATLVAVICAAVDVGRSAGAVYTPVALIVPLVAVPPAMPLTLQVTLVLLELVTVATNACEAPSTTDALPGVMVTLMVGGAGDGGDSAAAVPAPPLAQPSMHALAARTAVRKTKTGKDVRLRGRDSIAKFLAPPLERGRTSAEMQAKDQGKKNKGLRSPRATLAAALLRKLLECEGFSSTFEEPEHLNCSLFHSQGASFLKRASPVLKRGQTCPFRSETFVGFVFRFYWVVDADCDYGVCESTAASAEDRLAC